MTSCIFPLVVELRQDESQWRVASNETLSAATCEFGVPFCGLREVPPEFWTWDWTDIKYIFVLVLWAVTQVILLLQINLCVCVSVVSDAEGCLCVCSRAYISSANVEGEARRHGSEGKMHAHTHTHCSEKSAGHSRLTGSVCWTLAGRGRAVHPDSVAVGNKTRVWFYMTPSEVRRYPLFLLWEDFKGDQVQCLCYTSYTC